ncbi:MAG TPA: DUF1080 domain-containing protein [Chitinophagaceae bacterium]|nr:DUF1080 domain-containing protein [Chitinophagaceae bacterium]
MRTILLAASAATLLLACNSNESAKTTTEATKADTTAIAADNTLTDQEKKDGWELLFDGTTKGWHKYGDGAVGSSWKADSTLHLDASKKENWQVSGGGDIVTDEEFTNFDLKLDWKIDTGGNSGVMFYVHEGKDSAKYAYAWYTGPEMQVLDNNGHPDAKIPKHRAGDLYDLISCSKETVKPALQWNHAEIVANNGKLDLYLNGENVVSTTLWDANWKKLVAGSKFKDMPEFGTYKVGRIALQDHGFNVWFKNIKIKKL